MEVVKKTEEFTIYKKKNNRFAIRDAKKNWINGDEKAKILIGEKLITAALPKEKPAEEEAPAQETAAEDTPAEDTPAEENASEETKEAAE